MDSDSINKKIGMRIRDLRNRNGLTQQELADRTELTKGFISQLERGQVSASIVTLMDLEYFEKFDDSGSSIQWVIPTAQQLRMEPLLVVLQPHSGLEEDKPHDGEEFGFLISGRLTLRLGEKTYNVRAGESFYYQATVNHQISNAGARPAKFIWISTPPSF